MVSEHLKRGSILLLVREMEIKATVSYYCVHTVMTRI